MEIKVVGNAHQYMPVILDVINDIFNQPLINIYYNLDLIQPEVYFENDNLKYNLIHFDSINYNNLSQIVFGVNGPKAKNKIFLILVAKGFNSNHFLQIIHPTSYVSKNCKLSKGIFIEPMCSISSQVEIEFGVTIKRNVSVGHHSKIGKLVEINPGSKICSFVNIGEGSIIGAGTIIKEFVRIGKNTVIGMGSIVTKDIPDNVVAYGNPCKVIKENY